MSSPCTNNPDEVVGKIVAAKADADKFSKFVNGTAQETVQLGGGEPTPVIRNVVAGLKSTASQLVQFVADLPEGDISMNSATAMGSSSSRLLADRFADSVNVKDFGAKGDGSTDDTAAFQLAAATGKPVYVPDGSYVLTEDVSGSFFGSAGAKTSIPVSMACISEFPERGGCLVGQGSHLFELPYDKANNVTNWDRAIQGFAYDKFDDVLYCQAAYNHQGELVYVFNFSDRMLLGTNYDPEASYKGAFYDRFAHQNMALYRPSAEDEPLFFTSGPTYTAPDTTTANNANKLRLVRWNYETPTVCEIVKQWEMFDLSTYTIETPDVCISEDGSILCALARHTETNVKVVGVWNTSDILEAAANSNIQSLALHIYTSPWGNLPIGGQGMACDKDFIYGLRSGSASGTPHHIFGIEIKTGRRAFLREASWEGYELEIDGLSGVEGESINFLPVNSRMRLCFVGSVKGIDYNVPNFYDLETPSKPLDYNIPIRVGAGVTGTSADFDTYRAGSYYLTSGAMSDFSNGAWLLETKHVSESGHTRRQIAYRGNASDEILTRVITGEEASPWRKYLFNLNHGESAEKYPAFRHNYNNCILFRCLANRDTEEQSCAYFQRYRENVPQGESGVSTIFIGTQENTDWFSRIGISSRWAVTSGAVALTLSLTPEPSFPTVDGITFSATNNIGHPSYPWDNAYVTSGQISTSDARLKDNVAAPSDALMRAWGKVGFKVFQMKDALQSKGAGARIHVGVIAQEVQEAFASEGLDAGRYGLFCHDKWEDRYDDVDVVDVPAVYDEDGREAFPAQKHTERQLVEKAGDKYSIRYEEALALECAYQRWLGEQRDARIAALEARLADAEG